MQYTLPLYRINTPPKLRVAAVPARHPKRPMSPAKNGNVLYTKSGTHTRMLPPRVSLVCSASCPHVNSSVAAKSTEIPAQFLDEMWRDEHENYLGQAKLHTVSKYYSIIEHTKY